MKDGFSQILKKKTNPYGFSLCLAGNQISWGAIPLGYSRLMFNTNKSMTFLTY
jgi:hypothetical protein